ncbi:MAG: bifunctional 4-hydroxy-2-oxoglutarate aldolase/2-dehydro-3-deoxy-phosphogluconate aldolase [Ruminococcus sp.]|uniref:bifunctional 4-hydroxy-2-oxoglutarate aldolase/2-dehydro-3-deoxy-phosphogluconate aldolase n=1 Tax=Ruminococcus sp. TaxID=41978 RepID=UPI0025D0C0AC|nr:bifunctional 4-hydroxy-2-oxoglutarate aldolase/2-dehydro-3-deoxy-phosphogluconate aldolase [Ruminococcus sp.]MCR5542388.1 bifunctional 4-hydroxy-2-oxoglutarate aldolase/2-dehydro-3-deoxy-phosphogluconate aldolase [Ruminococcus sp.]
MDKIVEELSKIGIIPVVVIEDAEKAAPLAKALCEGGLPAAEVTFRTAAAKDAIAAMCKACPEMIVGAGTVLTVNQAEEALEAGAKFIVSPNFDEAVVKFCLERKVPVLPGIATPSELGKAVAMGLTEVKFFPAEQAGGLAMIKAMAAPFRGVKFMPTGGLNTKNIGEYLDAPEVIACGGSFMVNGAKIAAGDFEWVRRETASAVEKMLSLSFIRNENGINVFASKRPERAVYHMSRRGVEFDESTAVFDEKGLVSIDGAGMRIVRG